MLTIERLRELLSYDPETGIFRWKITRTKCRAGNIAGSLRKDGYVKIQIDGRFYQAHRLAWFYVYGEWPAPWPWKIDHIDGNRSNNAISNLREATHAQSEWNKGRNRRNTSGYKGVTFAKDRDKWLARITANGIRHLLGYFDTPEEAYAAYCRASVELHQQFARVA